jgi:outer membrane lipoprotein carrier protein
VYQRWFPYRCIKALALLPLILIFHFTESLAEETKDTKEGVETKETKEPQEKKSKMSSKGAKTKEAKELSETKDSKESTVSLPPLLEKIEEKYKVAKTIVAEFNQINELAALKQKKPSSGKITVKRPNKVKWETLKPDVNLLVSDGKKIWNYTPPFDEDERGQVIEMKTKNFKSSLAAALLAGSFSVAKDMKIQKLEKDSDYSLLPKKGTAGSIKEALIKIDTDKLYIVQVVLVHKEGNRTEINLSNIELGKEIDDKIFEFEVPPNTDRVDQK